MTIEDELDNLRIDMNAIKRAMRIIVEKQQEAEEKEARAAFDAMPPPRKISVIDEALEEIGRKYNHALNDLGEREARRCDD